MEPHVLRRFSSMDNSHPKWMPRLRSLSMARSTDSLDGTGDGPLRPLGNTTTSVKGKGSKRLSITRAHFPKLAECAHFHYETVDFGHIQGPHLPDSWVLSRCSQVPLVLSGQGRLITRMPGSSEGSFPSAGAGGTRTPGWGRAWGHASSGWLGVGLGDWVLSLDGGGRRSRDLG